MMTQKKKDAEDMVQVTFRAPRELLRNLKMRALFLNTSLQNWLMQAVMAKITKEDKTK